MASVGASNDLSVVIGERVTELIKAADEIDPAKVHFSRAYEIQELELPCVSVELGPDLPVDPDGQHTSTWTDSLQTVYVDIYDYSSEAEALIEVQFKRAVVHRALMIDHKLGQNFIVQVHYGGAMEPIADPESGIPGWTMRLVFDVHYRFNVTDRTIYT